jgi:hypothetical protein
MEVSLRQRALVFSPPGVDRRARRSAIAFAPLLALLALLAAKIFARDWYTQLIFEDGPVETLTALVYVGVALLSAAAALRLGRSGDRLSAWLFGGFAFACLLVSGEEISWGQRMFNLQSPEFFQAYNRQGELNAHNFLHRYVLHAIYIAIAFAAAFGWMYAPHLVRRLPPRLAAPLAPRLTLLLPPPILLLYFLPCLLFYLSSDYLNPLQVLLYGPEHHFTLGATERFFFVYRDQEPLELLMSVGFLLFAWFSLQRARLARA